MDPQANIDEQREIAKKVLDDEDGEVGDLLRLAELSRALDEWITNGGFLPPDWNRRT